VERRKDEVKSGKGRKGDGYQAKEAERAPLRPGRTGVRERGGG
jgi:hypothetical protein